MDRKGLGQYCVELLDRLYNMGDNVPLTIVETGTMFKLDFEPGEIDLSARSTYAIAKWISDSRGLHDFYSIDSDESHIQACAIALGSFGFGVTHCLGNAADYLNVEGFSNLDFVLLDSDSDADVILREYRAVQSKMSYNGIIVIDDAFKHPSVNKFRAVKALDYVWYALGQQAAAIPFGPEAHRICREVSLL